MNEEAEPAFPGARLAYDLAGCLRFYSRLPVPRLPGEGDPHAVPDFRSLPRMLPLAGLILGLPGAGVLLGAWGLGLGPFLAASLAVTAGVLVTGALHEDGLADVADGFGGGANPARRLEIMRDSRIGAYGGVALMLSLALRIGALATLLDRVGSLAALALVLAAALSRSAALAPLALLAPARPGGAGASVGRPSRETLATATALALALTLAALALGLPPWGGGLMIGLGLAAALGVTALAQRQIGGQTGDVVGAAQQAAEIAALLGLLAAIPA
ncbi:MULTISPECIES: adenosylcobinamide-GDP ribazoletransferase [unclassified Methylobacterium]|uniref:adenosylcobinamide-GDP ribazoletransferase n=1 Tax=unclassified Methylobacterium TaxID=2615210 RepID=UPI0006F4B771|nr:MULTISPECIES: adenosylcobinamide-GDP ribazoletransferase [unclassified Methylobacterium]KQP79319.1 cobalamin biosynthesis protein CobS [Methylobacterium sp. Leaf117]KQP88874.1 cobalamin biosynthesis protein CobS [Methylobacterium sp. Leaf113]MCK2056344.1 adenosylcobinamide-GDP ribazoletransferase [Methylobacterium sp. 37f]